MKFIHKETNKKSRKRRTYKNKKYKGGDFKNKTTNCEKSVPSIKELTKYIKEPYNWTIQLYDSTKCHLFIWKNKTQNPHIHVHTFLDREYRYTVNHETYTVKLIREDKKYYESVLIQMYENLTGKPIADPVFMTPDRYTPSDPTTERPMKSEKKPSGLMSGIFESTKRKLGPDLGKEVIYDKGSLI